MPGKDKRNADDPLGNTTLKLAPKFGLVSEDPEAFDPDVHPWIRRQLLILFPTESEHVNDGAKDEEKVSDHERLFRSVVRYDQPHALMAFLTSVQKRNSQALNRLPDPDIRRKIHIFVQLLFARQAGIQADHHEQHLKSLRVARKSALWSGQDDDALWPPRTLSKGRPPVESQPDLSRDLTLKLVSNNVDQERSLVEMHTARRCGRALGDDASPSRRPVQSASLLLTSPKTMSGTSKLPPEAVQPVDSALLASIRPEAEVGDVSPRHLGSSTPRMVRPGTGEDYVDWALRTQRATRPLSSRSRPLARSLDSWFREVRSPRFASSSLTPCPPAFPAPTLGATLQAHRDISTPAMKKSRDHAMRTNFPALAGMAMSKKVQARDSEKIQR